MCIAVEDVFVLQNRMMMRSLTKMTKKKILTNGKFDCHCIEELNSL